MKHEGIKPGIGDEVLGLGLTHEEIESIVKQVSGVQGAEGIEGSRIVQIIQQAHQTEEFCRDRKVEDIRVERAVLEVTADLLNIKREREVKERAWGEVESLLSGVKPPGSIDEALGLIDRITEATQFRLYKVEVITYGDDSTVGAMKLSEVGAGSVDDWRVNIKSPDAIRSDLMMALRVRGACQSSETAQVGMLINVLEDAWTGKKGT
ncbi:hypothetical protein KJ596_03125 [Patescibacteria group bacterium]|nr:hypothetical protein [Patescibacteria group bacterium]MBU1868434.1 hypothetical protein [Patescibacteria group bacterium]